MMFGRSAREAKFAFPRISSSPPINVIEVLKPERADRAELLVMESEPLIDVSDERPERDESAGLLSTESEPAVIDVTPRRKARVLKPVILVKLEPEKDKRSNEDSCWTTMLSAALVSPAPCCSSAIAAVFVRTCAKSSESRPWPLSRRSDVRTSVPLEALRPCRGQRQ